MDFTSLDQGIDDMESLAIELQTRLTAVPAIGPLNEGRGEKAKMEVLESSLAELGFPKGERIDASDDRCDGGIRPNLVVRSGDKEGPTLWILSHIDVVPPGDIDLWETDPWTVSRDGPLIRGRGVEDNQQGLVSSILALKSVREAPISHNVGLLFVSDEETGSALGLGHVLKTRPELIKPTDLVLVPDAGNADGTMVEVAEKSMLWMKIVVEGEQCHGSMPALGTNAAIAGADLLLRLDSAFRDSFPEIDPLFDPPTSTFAPTRREENQPNINMVPGRDVLYFDCRVLPQTPLSDVRRVAREIADEVETQRGVSITLSDHMAASAAPPTPLDAPVVTALLSALEEVTGKRGKPAGIGGGTVAALFRESGIPAVVWSTLEDQAHQPNESCRLSNLLSDAKVMVRLMA
ncbi:M20 family metallo-hydrolase [bacterium]|nr:M20 family metallo-hydrolase [bacterium]